MNAAASSADITLSATASHRRRDRSAILTLPPAPRHHDDPVTPQRPAWLAPATWHHRSGNMVRQTAVSRLAGRPWPGWDLRFYRQCGDGHRLGAAWCADEGGWAGQAGQASRGAAWPYAGCSGAPGYRRAHPGAFGLPFPVAGAGAPDHGDLCAPVQFRVAWRPSMRVRICTADAFSFAMSPCSNPDAGSRSNPDAERPGCPPPDPLDGIPAGCRALSKAILGMPPPNDG